MKCIVIKCHLHTRDRSTARESTRVAGWLILTSGLCLARSPKRREYQFGTRLNLARRRFGSAQLEFKARKCEASHDVADHEHAIGSQFCVRF